MTPGTKLGRYEIRSKIGQGGMGEVYLAQDTKLDRKVAVKILPTDVAANRNRMQRFIREAKSAAALNHPNIAHVYEIGEHEGVNFIAMEYVEGVTLQENIHREHTDLKKLLRYLQQVAEGLTKAHAAGIVHRDLKPDNVMITRDGYAKILDFGLAKLAEPIDQPPQDATTAILQPALSTPGIVMGTVGYMSPEQAQGKPIDHRSDIFSFGCLLYEAATGERAFHAESVIDTLHKIVHAPVPLVRNANPLAPTDLTRIVRRCLEKDPDERYQSIKEVAIELRQVRHELEGAEELDTAVPPGSTGPTVNAAPAKTTSTSGAPPATSSIEYVVTGIMRHKIAAVLALAMVTFAAIVLTAYLRGRNTDTPIDSIAVLPFDNQNHDPDTDYLSDGLTESIINNLTQIPNLRVIARGSAFRYKARNIDPITAGHELGVRGILTGRLLQRGDSLAVSAELVDVRDNKQLWGEHYERKVSDLLTVQREIGTEISSSLRLKLSAPEQTLVTKRYTDNPEAYQLYLKGRFYWNKRTEEGLRKGIEYFQQAIERDPTYALAYAGIADCYSLAGLHLDVGSSSPSEAIPKAKAAAMRALELDDTLGEAHTSLAFIKFNYDWDWPGAEREFRRGIELSPNSAHAHHWYSHYLMAMGNTEGSLAESKRALELDPLGLIMNVHLGWHYTNAHQTDLAIDQFRKTLEMDPNYGVAHWYLAVAEAQKGNYSEAEAELRKAKELLKTNLMVQADTGYAYAASGQKDQALKVIDALRELSKQKETYVSSYHVALIYTALGQRNQAFEWLENAYRERSDLLVYLKVDSRLNSLRSDPRFADLMRRVGLPQ